MEKAEQAKRLKLLYSIIDGIPARHIDMDGWRTVGYIHSTTTTKMLLKYRNDCRTVACALGWASAHPKNIEKGLDFSSIKNTPIFRHDKEFNSENFYAGAHFYGITYEQSYALFGPVQNFNDKAIFLERLRNLMVELCIISKQRAKELSKLYAS